MRVSANPVNPVDQNLIASQFSVVANRLRRGYDVTCHRRSQNNLPTPRMIHNAVRTWPIVAVARVAYFGNGDDTGPVRFSVSAEKHCASN